MNGSNSPKTPISKQKGFKRIVIGLVLIIFQIIAVTGAVNQGNLFESSPLYLCGFFSFAVAGILLIIFGVMANRKDKI